MEQSQKIQEKRGDDTVIDFLNEDNEIPSQKYVCISFISPTDAIKSKEGFRVAKFLQSYSKTNDIDFNELYNQYTDFCYKFNDNLDDDYSKESGNITNIHGVKIRGSYSSKEEAVIRAEYLQKSDKNFHVFVGEVGKWLPWSPCADHVDEEVFAETQLNELIKKYKENTMNKDIFFNERKEF